MCLSTLFRSTAALEKQPNTLPIVVHPALPTSCSKLFSELVVLLELVCPQRYNGQQHQGAKLPSSAGGSSACQLGQGENKPHEAAAAALQEICCNDTTMLESETQGIAAARAAAQVSADGLCACRACCCALGLLACCAQTKPPGPTPPLGWKLRLWRCASLWCHQRLNAPTGSAM